jgi:tRNA-dihydrouridine synthase
MMRSTECDGVVVGRGCLGRPWLFRDLAEVFSGREPSEAPRLGAIVSIMLEHARLLAEWCGEAHGIRFFRKHATWYTKGFPHSAQLRGRLIRTSTLAELAEELADLDPDEPFPSHALRVPRGKSGGRQKVALPEGYLDQLDDDAPPDDSAEDPAAGG